MNSFHSTFSDVGRQAYMKVMDLLPEAALAVLILGVGILAAIALHFMTLRVLDFFAVDKLAGKTPVDRMLKSVGIKKTISEIVALLVFWLCVLLTLVLASRTLHLPHIANAIDTIVRFIPRVIAVLLIVVFGMLLAKFLEVLVEQPLRRTGFRHAHSVGRGVYMITVIFALLFAFDQLGLNKSSVTANVLLVFSALLVIFSVGLMIASRSVLENMISGQQARQILEKGQKVQIDGKEGTVESFTLTTVVLRSGDKTLVIPSQHFQKLPYTIEYSHDE